jgi:hypothetical protein
MTDAPFAVVGIDASARPPSLQALLTRADEVIE